LRQFAREFTIGPAIRVDLHKPFAVSIEDGVPSFNFLVELVAFAV